MITDAKSLRAIRWLLFILVLGVSLAYLTITWGVGKGRPVAPLDDSYISYQYARQIARGAPRQYNDGDPPSLGMTSLLHPWLLAGLYKLGCRGERLVGVAVSSGALWLGGIVLWVGKVWDALEISTRHPRRWATLAAVVVLLTGIVQWGAFTGMETGLFTLLLLVALESILRRRIILAALWLCLAGLTRPEGMILAILAWLAFFARLFIGSSARSRLRAVKGAFMGALPLGIAVIVGLIPSLLNWLIAGTPASAGLEAKAWFYNVPQTWGDILRSIALGYWRIFVQVLNGWGSGHEISGSLVASGLTVMATIGWGVLALRRRWEPLLMTAGWFWLGTLSTATLITATWHLGRYQAPFVPLAVVLAVVGISALWERTSRSAVTCRIVAASMLVWLLGSSLLSTYHALIAFRQVTQTVTQQQLVLADWLRDNLPAGARVGVHDSGSLRYVGEHPTYDLVGLTTAEATRAWRHGAGSVFEQMEHSSYRPDYFAIYPGVFSISYLAATDLFDQELFRVEVSDYAVVSAGPVQRVWQADWRLAGSGERMAQPDILARTQGLTLVDTLDVADLADEAAHRFRWWHNARHSGFPTEVYQMRYRAPPRVEVLDGGRLVSGGMAFRVQTQADQPLWIAARLHAQQAGAVQIVVNGRQVGWWAYPHLPGEWLETLFLIPAAAIVGEQTEIRLEVDVIDAHFRHYAPYHFWFWQGQSQGEPAHVSHPLDVTFDRDLHLLGFDLSEDAVHPGQVLSATLYWRTDALVESDAKVFLHLYDVQGNLGSQTDGWPVFGTRPPYTWQVNETVSDPQTLLLPPDLPPGHYILKVGLYDKEGRLTPTSGTKEAFLEKRVPLAEIEIVPPR